MSTYSVVYIEANTQRVEAVLGRGMQFHTADSLAAKMWPKAQPGYYFVARNDNEVEQP